MSSRLPGDDWLDVAIDASTAASDPLLVEVVAPWISALQIDGEVDWWCFERLPAAQAGLRIRAHGSPNALWARAYPALHEAVRSWVSTGRARALRLETYDTNAHRLGDPVAANIADRLAHADSDAALSLVAQSAERERWLACLRGLHEILSRMIPDVEARFDLLLPLLRRDENRTRGARPHPRDRRALSPRSRTAVATALRAPLDATVAGGSVERLARVAEDSEPDVRRLAPAMRTQLVHDVLRAHANRVIRSRHQRHRLLLFEYLARFCRSEKAQQR